MNLGVEVGLVFAAAYLVGSLPFGLLVAQLAAGVDIRKQGSGNIGATNVARVFGAKFGLLVLVLDCLKGALPTAILPLLFVTWHSDNRLHLAVAAGVGSIIGHMYPIWLRLRGGKGVATSLGVVLVLAPVASAIALGVFIVAVLLTQFVSMSSIAGACTFGAVELLWILKPDAFSEATWSLAAFSALVPLLIIARHRTNLVRLMRGEEPRFRFGKKQ